MPSLWGFQEQLVILCHKMLDSVPLPQTEAAEAICACVSVACRFAQKGFRKALPICSNKNKISFKLPLEMLPSS